MNKNTMMIDGLILSQSYYVKKILDIFFKKIAITLSNTNENKCTSIKK